MSTKAKAVSVLSVLAAATPALPAAAQSNGDEWRGFYVGAHGAIAKGETEWEGTNIYEEFYDDGIYDGVEDCDGVESSYYCDRYEAVDAAPSAVSITPAAIVSRIITDPIELESDDGAYGIGVLAGYNFNLGNVVLGVEADATYLPYETEVHPGDGTYILYAETDHMETIRGRIGYAFDNLLIFATGGWVFSELDYHGWTESGLTFSSTDEDGYAYGGGFEFFVDEESKYSVGVNVLAVEMDDEMIAASDGNDSISATAETSFVAAYFTIKGHF